jgi:small-conductance mechanosensitive channel
MTHIQIIEASVAILLYFVLNIIINRNINRIVEKKLATKTRSKIAKKAVNLTLLTVFTIILLSIFGVDQSELAVFIGSVLTVLGIALFAQWSILSNITSGIIIFFNHTVKLDDTIAILDKDYDVEGRISDIGLFFVILKTQENEQISIPNSVFLNKMIKKKTAV